MTYLPFFVSSIPISNFWRSPTRHLRLMGFNIGLRQFCTFLLVDFEVCFLAVFVTVADAVTLVAVLNR